MLIGSTYAWFTDSASTGVNTIQAGNLDIVLEYYNGTTWTEVSPATRLFDESALWEPGHTEVAYLHIKNAGSLDLKYKMKVNVPSETGSINQKGEAFKLSNYLVFGKIPMSSSTSFYTNDAAGRDAARTAAGSTMGLSSWTKAGNLYANPIPTTAPAGSVNEEYIALVIYMPETVGNVANHQTGTAAPKIELGVNIVATQLNSESDSFGSTYDEGATYPVTDNKGLKDAISSAIDGSTTVHITSGEYTLSDSAETSKTEIPAGTTIVGAGANNTTLNVNKDKIAKDNVTLKDMTIIGSGSQGTDGTLNINGNNTTIENIDYKGDSNIAIAVSTGGNNSGTIFRGTKITNAFRGIQFWSLSGDSVIDNCVLDVAGYTFNIDAAVADSTLTITNSTLNGWTSYTSGIKQVTFDSCKLGLNAYSYLRPYSETTLVNCEFTYNGYQLNAGGTDAYTITLTNCTINGTLITEENVKNLLLDTDDWNSNATLIVNGVTVSV